MKHTSQLLGLTVLGWALLSACEVSQDIDFKASFGHVPQSLEAACPAEVVPKPDYLKEIDMFRVRIHGADMSELRQDFASADLSEGQIQVNQIPAGADRDFVVSGMLGKVALWRGAQMGVNVDPGQNTEVSVLLARLAAMSCTRSPMSSQRVFPSAINLQDGRVLLTGGFFQYRAGGGDCPGCRVYSGTASAEIYDPGTGRFSPVADMNYARGLHKMALLSDGRVLVVGGAGELTYDPTQIFPLVPSEHRVTMEIFDPKTKSFSLGPEDPDIVARVFHTVTSLADGRVLIAGGGPMVTAQDASNKTALCELSGGEVLCIAGPPMHYHRIGHTATLLDDTRVFFWGGVTDSGAMGTSCDQAGVTQCPEWYRPDIPGFIPVDPNSPVAGSAPATNLFFAAATSLGSEGVLIAGGLLRSGTGALAFGDPSNKAFIYNNRAEVIGNAIGGREFLLGSPRIFAQVVPLAVAGRAFFAGGYESLTMTPSRRFDIFSIYGDSEQSGGFMADITTGGEAVRLRQPRGGIAMSHVGAGQVLIFGGETLVDDAREVLGTAEIFADKAEPEL